MTSTRRSEVRFWLWAVVISAALVTLVVWGVFALARAQCETISEVSGRKTEFRTIGGCFVEVQGRLVPAKSWREVGE